ncbi:hypothetical protein RvY_12091 [Ramazzottius varieornatus]|uniref:CUB domain-containing protein n=1 Tax=Ramazzottius varieornatus TaxID=947166 RepID=A0A1D1VI82_RAMVA|nr:hypothetical protein RvY_12091 [Ramazzottius varieornatus]
MVRLLVLTLALLKWITAEADYYNLSNYCMNNRTIVLPCGADYLGRVGTLKFQTRPLLNCSIPVTIDTSTCASGSGQQTFKLYINFKSTWTMPFDDALKVYENFTPTISSPNSDGTRLIRSVSRSTFYYDSPTSCTHLLTRRIHPDDQTTNLDYITGISLIYTRGGQAETNKLEVTLDYTVVTGTANGTNIYCYSTAGYVPKSEMCNGWDDRVVCPSEAPSSSLTSGGATDKYQGSDYYSECPQPTRTTRRYPSYTSTTDSYPAIIDIGAIVSIVLGLIIFIACITVMTLICRRRRTVTVVRTYPPTAPYCDPQINQGYTTTTTLQASGMLSGPQQLQGYPAVPGAPPPYGSPHGSAVPTGYPPFGQSYETPMPANAQF